MMNETDKKVYALLLSFEVISRISFFSKDLIVSQNIFKNVLNIKIEAASSRLRLGEREFVISPSYGANFIQTVTSKPYIDHKLWQIKKSFDWMLDEQFQNLQVCACNIL
jgi:hypothetical protein